jgi:ribosomal protein S18 acetylase RimI-like enzyme
MQLEIGPLQDIELSEAWRICNLAFGTFLNVPDPSKTFGDRDLLSPRFRSGCTESLAARDSGKLIGSVMATRWGSFGFFGPLTVLPEYWDQGIAKSLLEETVRVFERWGVRHSGLFTFPHSAKHIGLYRKFGYC